MSIGHKHRHTGIVRSVNTVMGDFLADAQHGAHHHG
jgi:hypothetical protein